MRLALVTHKVDFQDGQGRVNYEVVRAALERGDHVTVVAEFCSDEIAQHPRARFIHTPMGSFPTQLLKDLYFAGKSARWLRKHRHEFDLVQANGFVTWERADIIAVHFVHAAWLRNPYFPFHWSSFKPYDYYQRTLTILNAYFERKAFQKAKLLIAVSSATLEEVVKTSVPKEKVRVVYNGVDIDEFSPGIQDRQSFGLPAKVPLALFAGDIRTPRKNLDTVLQAMVYVPQLHLAVAGKVEGSPYPELARQLGIGNRVHFIGLTKKMHVLMRSVDFLVLPSRYETYGLVVTEAMASGLPVILSANVGAAEIVNQSCIVISSPEALAELSEAMSQLVRNPEKRKIMSAAARQQAMAMQWSKTTEGYLKIYDILMDDLAASRGTSNE